MEDVLIQVRLDKDILRSARKKRGITQVELAEKIGIKQNSLSQSMSRPRMSLGMFAKILDVLGYDVIVVDRESGEASWQLYVEREEEEDDI